MTHGVSANTTWCGLRDAAGSVSYSKDVEDVDCIDCFRFRVRDLVEQVEELERAPRCCADTIPPGCRTCRCADAAEAKLARCVEALRRVLTEAGMQAHKHGCPNRLVRPARWDEHRPCAGCEAEAALIDTVVAKEG